MKKTASKIRYQCEHTERVVPNKLKSHPKNPNKHPSKQIDILCKNIERFGWRHPIVVSKLSGCIICGHARQQAAIKLKCDAPVDYQDFESEVDELAILMADNLIPELAEMDPEIKKEVYNELKIVGYDMEIVGYEEFKIEGRDNAPDEKINRGSNSVSLIRVFISDNVRGEIFNEFQKIKDKFGDESFNWKI